MNLQQGRVLRLYINFANETHCSVAFFVIPPVFTFTIEVHACFSVVPIIGLFTIPVGVRHRLICRPHFPHERRFRRRIYALSCCPQVESQLVFIVAVLEVYRFILWKYAAVIARWWTVYIVWVLMLPTEKATRSHENTIIISLRNNLTCAWMMKIKFIHNCVS